MRKASALASTVSSADANTARAKARQLRPEPPPQVSPAAQPPQAVALAASPGEVASIPVGRCASRGPLPLAPRAAPPLSPSASARAIATLRRSWRMNCVAVAASSRRRSQPSLPTASDTARWPTTSGNEFGLEQNVDCVVVVVVVVVQTGCMTCVSVHARQR